VKNKTDLKMDVRDMKAFEDASFDAVIDKGVLRLHCLNIITSLKCIMFHLYNILDFCVCVFRNLRLHFGE